MSNANDNKSTTPTATATAGSGSEANSTTVTSPPPSSATAGVTTNASPAPESGAAATATAAAAGVTIKTVLGDDVRRLNVADITFAGVQTLLLATYKASGQLKSNGSGGVNFTIKYKDDENELVTLTSTSELQDAIALQMSVAPKQPLKIYVFPTPAPAVTQTAAAAVVAAPAPVPVAADKPKSSPAPAAVTPAAVAGDVKSTPAAVAVATPAASASASAAALDTKSVTPPAAKAKAADKPALSVSAAAQHELIDAAIALCGDPQVLAVLPEAITVGLDSIQQGESAQTVLDSMLASNDVLVSHPIVQNLIATSAFEAAMPTLDRLVAQLYANPRALQSAKQFAPQLTMYAPMLPVLLAGLKGSAGAGADAGAGAGGNGLMQMLSAFAPPELMAALQPPANGANNNSGNADPAASGANPFAASDFARAGPWGRGGGFNPFAGGGRGGPFGAGAGGGLGPLAAMFQPFLQQMAAGANNQTAGGSANAQPQNAEKKKIEAAESGATPTPIASASATSATSGAAAVKQSDAKAVGGEEIHVGISCDACGMKPIVGIRYQCAVCDDYDLCAGCEKADAHDPEHSLVKLRAPRAPPAAAAAPNNSSSSNWRSEAATGAAAAAAAAADSDSNDGKYCAKLIEDVAPRESDAGRRSGVVADGDSVLPGALHIRTWKVMNSGRIAWAAGTKLCFLRGDRQLLESSVEEFPLADGGVAPGAEVELSAILAAPEKPGKYMAVFRLSDASRSFFGPRLFANLVVIDPSKPAPALAAAAAAKQQTATSADAAAVADKKPATAADSKADVKANAKGADLAAGAQPKDATTESDLKKYSVQLTALAGMGFTNTELNVQLLHKHGGNVNRVCQYFFDSAK